MFPFCHLLRKANQCSLLTSTASTCRTQTECFQEQFYSRAVKQPGQLRNTWAWQSLRNPVHLLGNHQCEQLVLVERRLPSAASNDIGNVLTAQIPKSAERSCRGSFLLKAGESSLHSDQIGSGLTQAPSMSTFAVSSMGREARHSFHPYRARNWWNNTCTPLD